MRVAHASCLETICWTKMPFVFLRRVSQKLCFKLRFEIFLILTHSSSSSYSVYVESFGAIVAKLQFTTFNVYYKRFVFGISETTIFCWKNGDHENYSVHFIAKTFFIVLMCTLESVVLAIFLVSNPLIVWNRMKITVIIQSSNYNCCCFFS